MPPNLITPLEPGARPRAKDVVRAGAAARQSTHSTALRRIEAAVASSCGSQHDANEDAHSELDPADTLFVVADGVGGGAMAQTASRELVAHLRAALEGAPLDAGRVRRTMLDADRAVARRIAAVTDWPGAATVVLCAPVNASASRWLVAWVGDCRAYRLSPQRAGGVERLTRDDTFRHLAEPPPAGGAPDDPARMVGNGAIDDANVEVHDLASGDLLVLCSDGVHKFIDDDVWCRLLAQAVPLAQRCVDVIAEARANGSVDDATVLVVRRTALGPPRPRWMARWGGAGAADSPGEAS